MAAAPQQRNLSLQQLFLLVAFPIHVWGYYNLMREFPAWMARLNFPDLMASIGLSQLFIVLESVIIFVPFAILARLLPHRYDAKHRLNLLLSIIMVSTVWAILAHLNIGRLRSWTVEDYLPAIVVYLLSLLLIGSLITSVPTLSHLFAGAVERIGVLSALYFVVELITLPIVLVLSMLL